MAAVFLHIARQASAGLQEPLLAFQRGLVARLLDSTTGPNAGVDPAAAVAAATGQQNGHQRPQLPSPHQRLGEFVGYAPSIAVLPVLFL